MSLSISPLGFVSAAFAPRLMMSDTLEMRLADAMRAAQGGDKVAYGRLLRDCTQPIAAVARRQGVRDALVDDVVQETLLTIHQIRHTWDPSRPFLPWLRAIAARRAIDGLRKQGRHGAREVFDPISYEAAPEEGPGAAEAVDRADDSQRLGAAIATLPDGQREAVEQLVIADRSLKEAAGLTGKTEGALKVNLHRAIKSLRGRMAGATMDG